MTISTISKNKSTGPNSIPTKLLHELKYIISKQLSNLVNLAFVTGTFPDLFKLAKVIPVYKKGDPLLSNNYRPISLLSNIGKLIEKLVHTRIYNFFEKIDCLYNQQFGFRASHSTNDALIQITETIRTSLDKGQFSCGVFLDFQKAFDTVNHKILLSKLEHYGIRGIALDLIKSYLSNRKQYVTINDIVSNTLGITLGVPQGSVLGPLLFLVYINDLHNVIEHSLVHHFADDTNLLYSSSSLKKINKHINHDLKLIVHWLRANRISLNVDKTEIMFI